MAQLTGNQRKQLRQILINAFPTQASLRQMLLEELNWSLETIAGGDNYQTIVFNLIVWADAQERLAELLEGARQANPGNQELRHFDISAASGINNPGSQLLNRNPNTKIKKILILAATPNGLHLGKEIREIEEAIRHSIRREQFEIKTRQAVRPKDIRRAIAEEKPQIVHFCGHGSADGSLILENDEGQPIPVTPESLAELFNLHADYVECVLLNACHSEKVAKAISQHISYVIGMNQAVKDKIAIEFAQGFYDALGFDIPNERERFQRAFQEGVVAIKLTDISEAQIPSLEIKTS